MVGLVVRGGVALWVVREWFWGDVFFFCFSELGLDWSLEGCIYHINTPAF